MSEETEGVAIRLWRDRAQLREQERNEAQARLRIAEEKVAILMAENERQAAEIARLESASACGCGLAANGDRTSDGGAERRAPLR